MANHSQSLREFLELQATYQEQRQKVGETIRMARLNTGQTQAEAAAALGVSNTYLSQIESGARTPTTRTMNFIVNYFSTTEGGKSAPDQEEDDD